MPAKHPQAVKELTPPTVADTGGEEAARSAAGLSHWAIGKRGAETASVPPAHGSGLIATSTKMGREACPTQNRPPWCPLAPWHLSRGPGALAGPAASVPSGPGLRGSDSTLAM